VGKIVEITVSKGRTYRPSDAEEWIREEYSVKSVVDGEAELEAERAHILDLEEKWLSQLAVKATAPLPQLDPEELGKLPWKTYKDKQDCKPDAAGWIFSNTPGAEALADLIGKHGKDVSVPLQIGAYKFTVRFSGARNQFIGRALIKEAKK
jgi:hypothetical protein